ncbi:hypothetical protein [Pseudoflavitalea rhizosphaerae]|uniref:hypothetical protein n=1 Tax=Pseudoflavitalea rhizosphaerae TaxID=1884793 RepID=UPI000F8D5DC8|nr:hypothetical protein [Pseudoflavitalea rhizosphaerae]
MSIEVLISNRKVLTSTENHVPGVMLRLLYLIQVGGNSNEIFIRKLYYIYTISFAEMQNDVQDVLLSNPYELSLSIRKMIVSLSANEFVVLNEKSSKVKVSLTENGLAFINANMENKEIKKTLELIGEKVKRVTDTDLDKQLLIW